METITEIFLRGRGKFMRYPEFLKDCGVIGVTAPSDGITDLIKLNRLEHAIFKFSELGYSLVETENVRSSKVGVSSSARIRARQLEDLFNDSCVSVILCAAGGDFLLEMLSEVDFSVVLRNPKWIQGYSDPTGLLFYITTRLDIATIYGNNFTTFGMEKWHLSLQNNLEILKGNLIVQTSFDAYQSGYVPYISGLEEYHLDTPVVWKSLRNHSNITMKGRLIGGCLDLLVSMVGTRFDCVKEFITKYQQDGILWYFDNCELTSEGVIRGLWQLKEAGWFQYTRGILFGRSMTNSSYYDISFEDAIRHTLGEYEVEILWDLDIGHVKPSFTLINGALADVYYENGHGSIKFTLD